MVSITNKTAQPKISYQNRPIARSAGSKGEIMTQLKKTQSDFEIEVARSNYWSGAFHVKHDLINGICEIWGSKDLTDDDKAIYALLTGYNLTEVADTYEANYRKAHGEFDDL